MMNISLKSFKGIFERLSHGPPNSQFPSNKNSNHKSQNPLLSLSLSLQKPKEQSLNQKPTKNPHGEIPKNGPFLQQSILAEEQNPEKV